MPNTVVTEAIDRVASGEDLSADDASRVLREVMSGNASEAETAGFLIALRTKGETVAEIAGLARTMRELAAKVEAAGDLVDTAGTGGGRATFNVSTTAAFIAAGAGGRGGKARQPLGHESVRLRRRARGARREHRARAGGGGGVHRDRGLRLHVSAAAPPGHAPCRARPQGTRGPDDLQLPRPADQSGGRAAPGDRGLGSPPPRDDRG